MAADLYSLLRQRDLLFDKNGHASLSCYKFWISSNTTHFKRCYMQANEEWDL